MRTSPVGIKIYMKAKGEHGKLFALSGPDHPLSTIFTCHEGECYTLFAAFGTDRDAIDYYDEAVQMAPND